jgi:hypothetical protein
MSTSPTGVPFVPAGAPYPVSAPHTLVVAPPPAGAPVVTLGPTRASLDRDFTYHRPTPDEVARMTEITVAARALAEAILRCCPAGAERSTAYRLVREARMWANASIVCDPNRQEPDPR